VTAIIVMPDNNQNILIANREEDFVDNLSGSMFQEILNWRYQFILPVEDVDFLPSTYRISRATSL